MISDNVEPTAVPGHVSSPAPQRFPRRLRQRLIGLGVLTLLLLGVHVFLGSAHVAEQIRQRLQNLIGTEVTLEQARIGWVPRSTIRNLTVREPDSAPESVPFLRVPHTSLDLGLVGVLLGQPPAEIDLERPELHLRFAESGKLLTVLPRPQPTKSHPPTIRLRQAKVTLDQMGREPFTISGVDGLLTKDENGYTLTGTANDPEWGPWDVEAVHQPEEKVFRLHLKATQADVEQERLIRLPFVSPGVWQAVEISGKTEADIRIHVPIGGPKVNYRVDLDVERADLFVPVVELRANGLKGRVLIENSIVQLQDVNGDYAGGRLQTTARLDFSSPPSQLQFAIQAEGVQLHRLPRSWKLPPALHGNIDMSADLLLKLEKPTLQAIGKGQGEVTRANFAGLPWPRAIPIKLVAEGNRFRLDLPAIFFSRTSRPTSP